MLLALLVLIVPQALRAAPLCALPAQITAPHVVAASSDEPVRQARITGYTLALSWAPEYCHGRQSAGGDRGDALECTGALSHRFVLHGLWPDAADPKGWPQYCKPAALLTDAVLRANLCVTPSAQLLQHEWAKHGSCMAVTPEAYFAKAAAAFGAVRFPHIDALAHDRGLTAGALQQAFAAANPGVPADAFTIDLNRRGWLEEMHLCLALDLRPHACPAGSGGADAAAPVRIETGGRPPRPSRWRDDGDSGGAG